MKTDKESGAIRLMEAFGAASEELLERSEKAGRPESGGAVPLFSGEDG